MHPAVMTFQALRVAELNWRSCDGLAAATGLWLEWRCCRPDAETRRVCCCGRFPGWHSLAEKD